MVYSNKLGSANNSFCGSYIILTTSLSALILGDGFCAQWSSTRIFSVLCQNCEHFRSVIRRFLKRVVKFRLRSSYPRKRSCHHLLFLFSECNVACQFTRPDHKWFTSTGSESILKEKWHKRRRHGRLDDRGSCPVIWSWVSSFFVPFLPKLTHTS